MEKNSFVLPTGTRVYITNKVNIGKLSYGKLTYSAVPTDSYKEIDGVLHRKFVNVEGTDLFKEIWLEEY